MDPKPHLLLGCSRADQQELVPHHWGIGVLLHWNNGPWAFWELNIKIHAGIQGSIFTISHFRPPLPASYIFVLPPDVNAAFLFLRNQRRIVESYRDAVYEVKKY